MKWTEADKKLRELANNGYRSMQFEVTFHRDGETQVECSIYIGDYGWTRGKRWIEAFREMEQKIEGLKAAEALGAPPGEN
ncbi:MAG: hypothetical protein ACWGQW_04835 [bacterium]